MTMSSELSIGLLLGSPDVSWWFARAIERVQTESPATIEKIIIAQSKGSDIPEKDLRFYLNDIAEKRCWAAVALGQRIADRYLDPIPELQEEPITSVVPLEREEIQQCTVEEVSPYRVALPKATVDTLAETDIVFHLGVGILDGAVLDAPTHGVWGVHHGDLRKYRGGPPGFWEYVNGEDRGVATLQRFNQELDGGDIVEEKPIDISNCRTWREVRRTMCRETVPMLAKGVTRFANEDTTTTSPDELGPIYRGSDRNCLTTGKYISRTIPGWVRTIIERRLFS